MIAAFYAAVSRGASPRAQATPGNGGGSGDLIETAMPSGSSGFTVEWDEVAGADGYVIAISATSQDYDDITLYEWREVVAGGATLSKVFSSISSGTKYVRVAYYIGTVAMLPGTERAYTPS